MRFELTTYSLEALARLSLVALSRLGYGSLDDRRKTVFFKSSDCSLTRP